jgi:hypothetical protein
MQNTVVAAESALPNMLPSVEQFTAQPPETNPRLPIPESSPRRRVSETPRALPAVDTTTISPGEVAKPGDSVAEPAPEALERTDPTPTDEILAAPDPFVAERGRSPSAGLEGPGNGALAMGAPLLPISLPPSSEVTTLITPPAPWEPTPALSQPEHSALVAPSAPVPAPGEVASSSGVRHLDEELGTFFKRSDTDLYKLVDVDDSHPAKGSKTLLWVVVALLVAAAVVVLVVIPALDGDGPDQDVRPIVTAIRWHPHPPRSRLCRRDAHTQGRATDSKALQPVAAQCRNRGVSCRMPSEPQRRPT